MHDANEVPRNYGALVDDILERRKREKRTQLEEASAELYKLIREPEQASPLACYDLIGKILEIAKK